MPGNRRRAVALPMLACDRVGLRVMKCFSNGAAVSNRITALNLLTLKRRDVGVVDRVRLESVAPLSWRRPSRIPNEARCGPPPIPSVKPESLQQLRRRDLADTI